MKTKPPRAPKKLSTAINMALADQLKAEKHPKLEVNMDDWHLPYNGFCAVCFGGAVMHYKHNLSVTEGVGPDFNEDFGKDWKNVYFALDSVRNGEIKDALDYMELPYKVRDINVVEYADNRTKFRRQMRDLAKRLAKAGL